jgi:glycosyltransferase involved in cell wall biosynthesis
VVIPVYNVRDYVWACLQSVLAQTHRHLDVVVVDDGSTDGSGEIARRAAASDPRVRLVRTENQGLGQARNEGLAVARGEWVAFVDSDDWVAPRFVETLLAVATSFGTQIAQCGLARVPVCGGVNADGEAVALGAPVCEDAEAAVRRLLLGAEAAVVAWTKLYRRSLFGGGFLFPKGRLFEDCFLVPRLLHAAGRVATTTEVLYFYRRRTGSIMERPIDQAAVRDSLAMVAEVGAFVRRAWPCLAEEALVFEAVTRVRLLVRMCRQREQPGWWDAVAPWLVERWRLICCSRLAPRVLRARTALLAASETAFRVATRGVRSRLPVWMGGRALHRANPAKPPPAAAALDAGWPLVSVVIPLFNCREHVGRCVRSVLAQSHPRLDVVVVDDGSTDGGGPAALEAAGGDGRIRLISNENRGPAAARNEGLAAARGEWVVFVDADDWVAPDFVETLLGRALEAGADMAACGLVRVGPDGFGELPVTRRSDVATTGEEALRSFLTGGPAQLFAHSKIFRMTLFAGGVRFPDGRLCEDAATVWRLAWRAGAVAYLPQCLYFYRQRPGSLMRRPVDPAAGRDALAMLRELSSFVRVDCPGLRDDLVGFQVAQRMHLLYRLARQGGALEAFFPIAGPLRRNARFVWASRRVAWKEKLLVAALVANPKAFQLATRGIRGPLRAMAERVRGRGRGQDGGTAPNATPRNAARRRERHAAAAGRPQTSLPVGDRVPDTGDGCGNLVSVVVPVYNEERHLGECLRSVLAQTHQRLEVIVVDDGSKDASAEVAAAAAACDDRVRLVRTPNRGPAAALNEGLAAARGEWVMFAGADDWLAPNAVEALAAAARRHGAQIAVGGRWDVADGRPRPRPIAPGDLGVCSSQEAVRRALTGGGGDLSVCAKIYQLALFRESGIGFPVGRLYEDVAVSYRLLAAARAVAYVPDLVYYYRQRPGSITWRPVGRLDVDSYRALFAELDAFRFGSEAALGAELGAERERFQAAARLHLLYRMARHGGDLAFWDEAADWLVLNRRSLSRNPLIGWRTRAMLALIAASPPLARAAVRVSPRMRRR